MGRGGQGVRGQARLSYNPRIPCSSAREPPGQATPNLTAARRQDRSRRKTQSGPACESAVNVDRVRVHDQFPQANVQAAKQPVRHSTNWRSAFRVLKRLSTGRRPHGSSTLEWAKLWTSTLSIAAHRDATRPAPQCPQSRQGPVQRKSPADAGPGTDAERKPARSANPWWHASCDHLRQPGPAPICSAHRVRSSRCSHGSWARRPPMRAVRASNCRSWFDRSCLKNPVR